MDRLQTVVEKQYAKRRDLLKEQREIEKKLELVNQIITELEAEMSELDKAWAKQKNEGDPLSMRVLIEKMLDSRPTGLKTAEIVKELQKAGHRSHAKDPIANVDSTMYRHRNKVFIRGKDGRWTLAKSAEQLANHLQLLKLVPKSDSGEA